MKRQIKPVLAIALTIIASSCSVGSNEKSMATADNPQPTAVANQGIRGKWDIETIVFSDSLQVRPDEEAHGRTQHINFGDSTYFIQTNCNTFSGIYTLIGDSITFGDGMMTEMACDNMDTEDALRKILPDIATLCLENDSVVRLVGHNASDYIILRKAN